MPAAEERYLASLVGRVSAALGDDLVGVYGGGSWALRDYEPGRSDLDVAAVSRERLSRGVVRALAATLRHRELPCPARGLEFVLYPLEVVRSGTVEPGFDLNLNTGAEMAERIDLEPVPGESHWFAIDRSILARHGVALAGPPAATLFSSPSREQLLPVLAESLRRREGTHEAVLNACRTLRFATEGVWVSKRAAGAWMLDRGDERELVTAALRARAGGSPAVDPVDARMFLERVLAALS